MTVAQLLREMSSYELSQWIVYYTPEKEQTLVKDEPKQDLMSERFREALDAHQARVNANKEE